MNKSIPNNSSQNTQPIIVSTGSNSVAYIVLGIITIGGFFIGKKLYDNYKLGQENKKAAVDNSSNIASQIHAENRAGWTESNVQIDLYRQITDYEATQKAYKNVSGGKDMLEDTRKHISSSAYQQILNILGIKGGAIKATSQTAIDVQTGLKYYSWVTAKIDTRIRKSPKVSSQVFSMRPNIIGVAKGNTIVGLIDKATLLKNKGKLFYDDENSTFFLPVLIFDSNGFNKVYNAYVAIANVSVFKDQPKNLEYFTTSKWQYDQAYAINGF